MTTPENLRYTAEHEWAKSTEDGSGVRIGITHYAQEQLGDVVYVSLPAVGTRVAAGDAMGEVESTKSVSDLYAPVAGTVSASNVALTETPDLVNTDPYGAGWMVEIDLEQRSALDSMMDAAAYQGMLDPQ